MRRIVQDVFVETESPSWIGFAVRIRWIGLLSQVSFARVKSKRKMEGEREIRREN